ncbi:O-methyltransferase [Streptomyces polyrhachis]|uniref:O-methyltransferase n=1 Tax=Streptomyces polyrhachis TaxID=1282885 RepID=A0ABW2GQ72_9ACTN
MSLEIWSDTERFLTGLVCPPDPDVANVEHVSRLECLPPANVSALQGRQLELLAKVAGARRILEVGTMAGYSTLWLARALPAEGLLVTVENNPVYATIALGNIEAAGLASRVEVLVGNASDQLESLIEQAVDPFDFFFVDADEHNNLLYFERCLRLGRPGSVIVFDNVVRAGDVRDSATESPPIRATRQLLELVGGLETVEGVVFQTVGSKGHDGMLVVRII